MSGELVDRPIKYSDEPCPKCESKYVLDEEGCKRCLNCLWTHCEDEQEVCDAFTPAGP